MNQENSILIVEDDEDILQVLVDIFSDTFGKVFTAKNGTIALDILKDNIPDILLTDLEMPGLDGVELIMKLRAEGNAVPVIILSGKCEKHFLLKAIKLGVHDFVEKPFKKETVVNAVYRVLEMKVREKDLPNMMFIFGKDSKEVKRHQKLIGLLQAIGAKGKI